LRTFCGSRASIQQQAHVKVLHFLLALKRADLSLVDLRAFPSSQMNTNQHTFDRCIRKMEELWLVRTSTNVGCARQCTGLEPDNKCRHEVFALQETILQRMMTLLNITERLQVSALRCHSLYPVCFRGTFCTLNWLVRTLQVMQHSGSFQLLPGQTDLSIAMLGITASSIEQKFQQINELM
jgi:hypothetical protein